jgi:succinate dehydrogenase/fumarate reductase flavoprotein subunit
MIDSSTARECDVLIAGSGAGGLATATVAASLGLRVIVIEKADQLGGTTALSGGFLWLPGNPVSRRIGVTDSVEAARTYLLYETGKYFDAERVDAFLEAIPEAITFYEDCTPLAFEVALGFPDYHAEAPGGLAGGRSILAKELNGALLGSGLNRLRSPLPELKFAGMTIGTGPDLRHFSNATRSLRSAAYVVRRLMRHWVELSLYRRDARLTNGQALAGRLLLGALSAGADIRTSAAVKSIIVESGRVCGAVVDAADGETEIRTRRGVVLATGGFPHDLILRARLFPHERLGSGHLSPAPVTNTGDGLRMAGEVGGALVLDLPNAAAWVPVSKVPRKGGGFGLFPHFIDRGKPGLIAVRPDGRRFVNEADSYHDFVQGLFAAQQAGDRCNAFLIADRRFLHRFGLGFVKPFPVPFGHHLRSGYLKSGRTIAELAAAAGIDADGLARTVASYNAACLSGVDLEFGKGSRVYNRFYGDPDQTPNPCLAPIETPPFFAVEIHIGDLGTFDGVRTNKHAEVVDETGQPISGLYAVGNDLASIAGGSYPGGGITLGPALIFAYLAARHLAGHGR